MTAEAEAAWVERLEAGAPLVRRQPRLHARATTTTRARTPGRAGVLNRLGYPEGPVAYFEYIDEWRNSGDFDGLEFR